MNVSAALKIVLRNKGPIIVMFDSPEDAEANLIGLSNISQRTPDAIVYMNHAGGVIAIALREVVTVELHKTKGQNNAGSYLQTAKGKKIRLSTTDRQPGTDNPSTPQT